MAIRRLSPGTFLNGRSFGDAPLLPGDHLVIGPVEFEVLPEVPRPVNRRESNVPQVRVVAADPAPASSDAEHHLRQAAARITRLERTIAERQNETNVLLSEMQRLTGQIDDTQQQWRASLQQSPQQLREHFDAWRSKVQEIEAQFGEQREIYEQDRSAWLAQCQQIATSLQDVSRTQQDAIQHNLKAFHQKIEEVDQRFRALLEREQELSRQQKELDQACVEFERRVSDWEGSCEQTRQDLAQARAELDSQRKDWDAQRTREQERLDQWTCKLKQESTDLQEEREQLPRDADDSGEQQEALEGLNQQVAALRAQLDEAHTKRTEAQRKWRDRHSEMEDQLAATRAQIDQQEQEQKSLREELDAAQIKLKESEDRHQQQKSLEKDIQQLQSRCDKLTKELEETRQQRDQQEKAHHSLNKDLETAQARLQEVENRDADHERLQEETQQLQTRCDKLTQELEETRRQKDRQEQAHQSVSNELHVAQARLQEFDDRQRDDGADGEFQLLEMRCEELTRELEVAQQQRDQQQAEYEALQQQWDAPPEDDDLAQPQQWDAELSELRRKLESKESELRELQAQHQREQQETEELTKRQEEIDRQWKLLRQEQAQLEKAREEWQTQRKLEVSQAVDNEAATTLAEQRHGWEQERDQWQAEHEQNRAAFAQEREQWESRRLQQDNDFDDRRARLEREFDELQQLRESLRQQQAAGASSQGERQELEVRVQELERERERRLADIEQIRQQLEAERAALQQHRQQLADQELDVHTLPNEDQEQVQGAHPPIESNVTVPQADRPSPVPSELVSEVGELDNTDNAALDLPCQEAPASDGDHTLAFSAVGQPHSETFEDENRAAEPAEQGDFAEDDHHTLPSDAPFAEENLVFSKPTETAPVDTAAILSRFGHSVEDDEQDIQGPDVTKPVDHDAAFRDVTGEDDEALKAYGEADSIHDYMAELMQRVGGGASPTKAHAVSSATVPSRGRVTERQKAAGDFDCAETIPLDPSEFVPRAIAPEATSNLQALRAVANTSARSAIDKHQRQRFEHLALIFWGVACVGIMVCGAMAVWVDNLFSFPTYASSASLLVSVYAVSRALMYTAKAKFGSHATQKTLIDKGFDAQVEADPGQQSPSPAAFLDPSFGVLPAATAPEAAGFTPHHVETTAPEVERPEVPTIVAVPAVDAHELPPRNLETVPTAESPKLPPRTVDIPPVALTDTPTLIVDNENP